MQLYLIGAMAGGAAILVAFVSLLQFSTEEYALDVDAFKDQASLMQYSRVILTNIGRSTVTNIVIDFGSYKDTLPKLLPGEKWLVSPREGTNLDYVTVTADNGINIIKQFRTMPKVPGFGPSG